MNHNTDESCILIESSNMSHAINESSHKMSYYDVMCYKINRCSSTKPKLSLRFKLFGSLIKILISKHIIFMSLK